MHTFKIYEILEDPNICVTSTVTQYGISLRASVSNVCWNEIATFLEKICQNYQFG